jgi:hypothetical protein
MHTIASLRVCPAFNLLIHRHFYSEYFFDASGSSMKLHQDSDDEFSNEPKESHVSIEKLPRDIGLLLVGVGILGVLLPGVIGTPVLLVGGLILWPKAFHVVELRFRRRFPKTHRTSMQQVHRYLVDMDRRYPLEKLPCNQEAQQHNDLP